MRLSGLLHSLPVQTLVWGWGFVCLQVQGEENFKAKRRLAAPQRKDPAVCDLQWGMSRAARGS